MKKIVIALAAISIYASACSENGDNSINTPKEVELTEAQKRPESISVKVGDLIFVNNNCGPLCDAINAVTPSYADRPMSHIGFKVVHNKRPYIIEAVGEGVRIVTLGQFLESATGVVTIGRLKPEYASLYDSAAAFALRQIGKPYDDAFLMDNGKYYCSELVYDAFKYANDNKPFFELKPMTFKNPATNITDTNWANYFKEKGMEVPEGKLGCNPGGLSLSDKIDIIGEITLGK